MSEDRISAVCELGHNWDRHKNARNAQCYYCNNRRVLCGFNDLGCLHPKVAQEWSDSNEGSPHDYVFGSNKVFEWICVNNHTWSATIASRSRGAGCRECFFRQAKESNLWYNRGSKLLKDERPDLFKEVVNQNENFSISFSSHKEIEWMCPLEHIYELAPNVRVGGRGCPYCSGRKLLIGFNDVASKLPHLVDELVNKSDGELPFWIREPIDWRHISDDGQEHLWQMSAHSRINSGSCTICQSKLVIPGVNDVSTTHPEIASQWASSNTLRPTNLTRGNNERIDFICPRGHEWNALVKDATSGKSSCIDCKPTRDHFRSKGEAELCEFVESLTYIEENVRRFKKFGVYEIDCFCPDEKIAIDYNGIFWHQERFKGEDYHKNKAEAVTSLGFSHIVIWEDAWANEKDKICTELESIVKSIQSGVVPDFSKINSLSDPNRLLALL